MTDYPALIERVTESARTSSHLPGDSQYAGYSGLATFGQFEYQHWSDSELSEVDVAVLGVPYDNSTANRPGCRFGPRALRANAFTSGYHHLGLGVDINEWLTVRDVGDVACPHGQTEASLVNTRMAAYRVASQVGATVFLGGDHAITWPAALSIAEVHGWGRLGMIHFDAHSDAALHLDGNFASHGTPMRRLLESGALAPGGFQQIGLRGYWPGPDVFEYLRSVRAGWHLMDEVREKGVDTVVANALEGMNEQCDAVYLSVDVDVLDPGFAPATGTPEPAGMAPDELFRAVRKIASETNLVALDVMEFSPPYDNADVTANNAHRIVFEALSALAAEKLNDAGAPVSLPVGGSPL